MCAIRAGFTPGNQGGPNRSCERLSSDRRETINALHRGHDGAQLFFKDWGRGRPVVLIHGWPLDADMWSSSSGRSPRLVFHHRLRPRAVSARSDQTWDGYDYDTLADDLKSVLDALDVQDVALVGFSMGGGEIARYMSRPWRRPVHSGRARLVGDALYAQTADNPDGVDPAVFDGMIAGLKKDRPNFMATFAKTFFGLGCSHRRSRPT